MGTKLLPREPSAVCGIVGEIFLTLFFFSLLSSIPVALVIIAACLPDNPPLLRRRFQRSSPSLIIFVFVIVLFVVVVGIVLYLYFSLSVRVLILLLPPHHHIFSLQHHFL